MGDQPQKMQAQQPATTIERITGFFTPVVLEKTTKHVFYEREVNKEVEALLNLEKEASDLESTIASIEKKREPIDAEIKKYSLAYQRLPDKETEQAKMIKRKCMQYMAEQDTLTKRAATANQSRLAVMMQAEQLRAMRDAKRRQKLFEDSNRIMYGEMATLDVDTVQTTASDARDFSRQMSKMSSLMNDPFGVTCDDVLEPFSSKFDKLNFAEDIYVDDPFLLNTPQPQRTRPNNTNKNSSTATAVLEDDIF